MTEHVTKLHSELATSVSDNKDTFVEKFNIQSEIIGKEKHISVMGMLDSKEDRQRLVNLLHTPILSNVDEGGKGKNNAQNDISEVHITFFETPTLTADVIEALKFHMVEYSHIPLRAFVFHKHLSSYLSRLGIHNKLVFGKSLVQQPHQQIKAVAATLPNTGLPK